MTKNKHGTLSRNLGIASIILAFISPIASVVCGVVGLKSQKEKGKEERDRIINWIGIGMAIMSWIYSVMILL
jgi:hypothetical protein